MGGAGGKAGAGGMGGTGGATGGHRYARLVALSSIPGGPAWTSVAELQLLTTGNAPISRNGWQVTADSEELADENAAATLAIDGDSNTFWHSAWIRDGGEPGDELMPHELVIDLGAAVKIIGFTYLPRQTGENGRIANYEFYLSDNGTNWGTKVASGTFPAGAAIQQVTF